MIQRYRIAFLLSLLVFISLWATYLNLPKVEKKIKKIEKKVIQISIVTPALPKKIEEKKSVVIAQAIIPKIKKLEPKAKKIVKKIIKKPKKIKPKKIIKKVVTKPKPKPKPKKIVKKVIKKTKPKRIIQKIPAKIIKPIEPEIYYEPPVMTRAEPIIQRKVYVPPKVIPIPQPRMQTPTPAEPVYAPVSIPTPVAVANNGEAKKAFLRNVRSKLIANKKYPKIAKRRHIEGSVKVRFDISAQGHVQNIRFINGKRIFHKSIRNSLERTFPMGIPDDVRADLPISDVSVTLHFNIR